MGLETIIGPDTRHPGETAFDDHQGQMVTLLAGNALVDQQFFEAFVTLPSGGTQPVAGAPVADLDLAACGRRWTEISLGGLLGDFQPLGRSGGNA